MSWTTKNARTRTITISYCDPGVSARGHTWKNERRRNEYLVSARERDIAGDDDDCHGWSYYGHTIDLPIEFSAIAVEDCIRALARALSELHPTAEISVLTTDPRYGSGEEVAL